MIIDEFDRTLIDAVGKNSIIYPSVEIFMMNKQADKRGVYIGDNCCIYPRNRLVLGDMEANPNANIIIGDNVLINAGGYLSGEGELIIHDHVLIGPNVCIISAGHACHDPGCLIQKQGLTYGRIVIGKDVWVGGGAVVLQGVSIGEGAVIGAGSVVSRDIPPYAIFVGNPARFMRYRGGKSRKGFWWKLFKNIQSRC